MRVGFTPGPWEAAAFDEANGVGWMVVDRKRRNVARVYYQGSGAKTEATTYILAAAPEMLEALTDVRDALDSLDSDEFGLILDGDGQLLGTVRDQLLDKIEAILRKARGDLVDPLEQVKS